MTEQNSIVAMPTLYLLMNHKITEAQVADARRALSVDRIIEMPDDIAALWSQIPPELEVLGPYLEPLRSWLAASASPGDYVLIQGDFGACYLMVTFAFSKGLVPVYSTSARQAVENHLPDGTVELSHRFRHRVFRRYGK